MTLIEAAVKLTAIDMDAVCLAVPPERWRDACASVPGVTCHDGHFEYAGYKWLYPWSAKRPEWTKGLNNQRNG